MIDQKAAGLSHRERAARTTFLRAASEALFQDREEHKMRGEDWPAVLREAHEAIGKEIRQRLGLEVER